MTGADEASQKTSTKSKNNDTKKPPNSPPAKKKKGSDKIENNFPTESIESGKFKVTAKPKSIPLKKQALDKELEKKKQIDSALADWLGTGSPVQESPLESISKEKKKSRGILKRKVRTPREEDENTINQSNDLNNEDTLQNDSDKREISGIIKISIFSNLIRENQEYDKLGVKIHFLNKEINDTILPINDKPTAYPAQWLLPIKSKLHKDSKIELSVVDISSLLQISMSPIEIPIFDIPYLHESMIFGCQKHYVWKFKYQDIVGRLTIGVKVIKSKYISTITDEWSESNAGGCLDCASWSISPQFYFHLPFCEFVIIHLISRLGFTNNIGFYLLKLNSNYDSPDYFSPIIIGKNPNSFFSFLGFIG